MKRLIIGLIMLAAIPCFSYDADFMNGDGRPLKEILQEKDAQIKTLQKRLKERQIVAFKQGIEAGWWMRSECMVNNILNDPRLGQETKDGWHHQQKPIFYGQWEDVIESYDYGQNDKR